MASAKSSPTTKPRTITATIIPPNYKGTMPIRITAKVTAAADGLTGPALLRELLGRAAAHWLTRTADGRAWNTYGEGLDSVDLADFFLAGRGPRAQLRNSLLRHGVVEISCETLTGRRQRARAVSHWDAAANFLPAEVREATAANHWEALRRRQPNTH